MRLAQSIQMANQGAQKTCGLILWMDKILHRLRNPAPVHQLNGFSTVSEQDFVRQYLHSGARATEATSRTSMFATRRRVSSVYLTATWATRRRPSARRDCRCIWPRRGKGCGRLWQIGRKPWGFHMWRKMFGGSFSTLLSSWFPFEPIKKGTTKQGHIHIEHLALVVFWLSRRLAVLWVLLAFSLGLGQLQGCIVSVFGGYRFGLLPETNSLLRGAPPPPSPPPRRICFPPGPPNSVISSALLRVGYCFRTWSEFGSE